jgi:hypothetical protein
MNFTPSPLNARQFWGAALTASDRVGAPLGAAPLRVAPPSLSAVTLLAATLFAALGCGDTLDNAVNDATGGGSDAFSQIYESDTFQQCSNCHAPGGPGKTAGTEATEDWSTRATAFASLKRPASGLIGNFDGCNGVPLIGSTAATSLLVASLDSNTRNSFRSATVPDCTGDAISDMNLKLSSPIPSGLLQQLKEWIDSGAPDQ